MCFRGFGKSWILSAYAVWCLLWDQSLNILVVSASQERAEDFTQFCLRLLDMPETRHLKPREGDRQRMARFDVHGAPTMHSANLVACGVMGSLTGKRADIVMADDCEIPNTVETQGMREKLWKRTSEFTDLLKPEGPARVIYLGTPHSEDSIYNRLARERGFNKWIWPAQYPDARLLQVYEGSLAQPLLDRQGTSAWIEGRATDPERFDDLVLAEKRAAKTPSEWALQYLLDTSLSDYLKFPLKLPDVTVMDCDMEMAPEKVVWAGGKDQRIQELPCPGLAGDYWHKPMAVVGDWAPYEIKVMAIDPSGRGKDETAYAIVGVRNGYIYLIDAGGMLEGYEDSVLSQLAHAARKAQVHQIVVESNFGDGMFSKLLQPHIDRAAEKHRDEVKRHWSPGLEEVSHNRQKELRICDTLEGPFAGHRIVVDRALVQRDFDKHPTLPDDKRGLHRLFYQVARICREKGALHHDDGLDSFAIAVNHVVHLMGVDEDKAIRQAAEDAFQQELEDDLEEMGARTPHRGWGFGTGLEQWA